jgi:hypothetical protein
MGVWGKGAKTYIKKKAKELANGTVEDSIDSPAMHWGRINEPLARKKYEEVTGDTVELVGFVEYGNGIGCSPDGFIRTDMLVEFKCPYNQEIFKSYVEKGLAPKKYLYQMMHQMVTTGRDICAFFAYDPRTDEYFMKLYTLPQLEIVLELTAEEYLTRIRAAYEVIEIVADALRKEIAKSAEIEHVCACKSQVLTFSEHRDNGEKLPWE